MIVLGLEEPAPQGPIGSAPAPLPFPPHHDGSCGEGLPVHGLSSFCEGVAHSTSFNAVLIMPFDF